MWTVNIKIFEKGTDIFLRTVDFVHHPQQLVKQLKAFTLEPETWASFSIVAPNGKEKGCGVIANIESVIDTFNAIGRQK